MKLRTDVDIYIRSQDYALRSIQLSRHLHKHTDRTAAVLARQYVRAATSIGANLIEAKSGESRRDFIHKFSIAQKEARESHYWLTLISRAELIPQSRLTPLIQETTELLAIITRIITTTKKNDQARK